MHLLQSFQALWNVFWKLHRWQCSKHLDQVNISSLKKIPKMSTAVVLYIKKHLHKTKYKCISSLAGHHGNFFLFFFFDPSFTRTAFPSACFSFCLLFSLVLLGYIDWPRFISAFINTCVITGNQEIMLYGIFVD